MNSNQNTDCDILYQGFNSPTFKTSQTGNGKKYFVNNDEITKDNFEEDISDDKFKDMIKEEVSKTINKSYDNIVVLAGAGASIAGKTHGKTVASLYDELNDLLHDEFYSFKNLKDIGIINECDIKDRNLESILSKLIKTQEVIKNLKLNDNNLDKDKLSQTTGKIKSHIYKATSCYEFNVDCCKHDTLIKKLSNRLPNNSRLNIVTTNYDTLFEEAASELNFWVFDGFSFSYPPSFDPDIFEWKLVKSIANKKTEELEYRQNMINLLKIHGSIDWKFDDNHKLTKIINSEQNNEQAVMIFPSSEKYMESYQEPYFSLMTKFQELLRQPNTLFITIGFSFADNHIFEMILHCIKHNHSLSTLITDYKIDNKNDNWNNLRRLSQTYDIHFLQATMNDDLTYYL